MSETESVTLGVPVYRGFSFIEETLRSIQAQTHRNIEVIISLDGAEPQTEELCRPFLKDSRFRFVVQPERLGWVGNINWLMWQVKTTFWCYLQQDDLIDPKYLETLVEYARQAPEAAVVYCDMVAFGTVNRKLTQSSVTGSAAARQLALLYEHQPAVAFRGLTRAEALRESGGIRPNEVENFCADTTWMSAIARRGELRRVPVELYRKRYHADNEHTKWARWDEAKRRRAWITHCADMLEQAMLVEATAQERRLLWLAAVARLVSPRIASGYLPLFKWSPDDYLLLLQAFFEYIRTKRLPDLPKLLESDWLDIEEWTTGFYCLPPTGIGSFLRRVGRRLKNR